MILKKFSKTINSAEITFCSNERFRGEVVTASSLRVRITLKDTIPFLVRLFLVLNSFLSSLVYSFAKLFPYFKLVSYTLSTMESRAESKNSGHPNRQVCELWM